MPTTTDRELLLLLAAQRAGFTETQLDALRRHDWTTLLAERTAAPDDAAPDLLLPPADDPPPAPDADLRADLARVAERLGVVRRQRDAALHLLRQLAAKLGCCAQCWGTDAACPTCAGHGSPGHLPPDPHLREWLAPALSRAGEPPEAAPRAPADPVTTDARTDGWD